MNGSLAVVVLSSIFSLVARWVDQSFETWENLQKLARWMSQIMERPATIDNKSAQVEHASRIPLRNSADLVFYWWKKEKKGR